MLKLTFAAAGRFPTGIADAGRFAGKDWAFAAVLHFVGIVPAGSDADDFADFRVRWPLPTAFPAAATQASKLNKSSSLLSSSSVAATVAITMAMPTAMTTMTMATTTMTPLFSQV